MTTRRIAVHEMIFDKKKRARSILRILRRLYPNADCALEHRSAFELLISTILAAQSTDVNVNRVTRALYQKYRGPADFLKVQPEELENDIHSTGFYHNKARSIIGTCRLLVDEYDGKVPDTMNDLVRLPGVARKTANVVLGTWFKKNEGVVVDTHVGRLAERMALTWNARDSKDAVVIEKDLMELFSRKDWTCVAHALVWHGRKICMAKKPACALCDLSDLCPSAFSFENLPPVKGPTRKRSLRQRSERR